jgi:hypothetical protein
LNRPLAAASLFAQNLVVQSRKAFAFESIWIDSDKHIMEKDSRRQAKKAQAGSRLRGRPPSGKAGGGPDFAVAGMGLRQGRSKPAGRLSM